MENDRLLFKAFNDCLMETITENLKKNVSRERNYFYFSLCHLCKEPKSELKKCASCRSIYYCSREHQLEDWPNHKQLCKVMAKTNKVLTYQPGCSPKDFNQFKFSHVVLWKNELDREFDTFENQMWMFPKVCQICYLSDADIICPDCLSVAYCNETHQEHDKEEHSKFCKELKLCMFIDKNIFEHGKMELVFKWAKADISPEVLTLPENLGGIMEFLGFKVPEYLSKEYVSYILTVELFVPGILIINALEKCGFLNNRIAPKTELVIHFLAFSLDIFDLPISSKIFPEFILHWITNLQKVTLVFVGPEVGPDSFEQTYNHVLCNNCKNKGCTFIIKGVGELYQVINHTLPKPDVVVGVDSKVFEFQNLTTEIFGSTFSRFIKHKGVPLVLTAFGKEEIKRDVSKFKGSQTKIIVKPHKNPYANLKPFRCWEVGTFPVFYQHSHFAVVAKK